MDILPDQRMEGYSESEHDRALNALAADIDSILTCDWCAKPVHEDDAVASDYGTFCSCRCAYKCEQDEECESYLEGESRAGRSIVGAYQEWRQSHGGDE